MTTRSTSAFTRVLNALCGRKAIKWMNLMMGFAALNPSYELGWKRAMTTFHDAAYTMAAVSATVALYRALVKKGLMTRDEAVRVLLDEAVARAIQAEAAGDSETTNDLNRQSAEILKFIAEKL